MCGRYFLRGYEDDPDICALIAEMNRREALKPQGKTVKTGEIFPGDEVLTVARSRAGNVRPFLMKWGFSLDKRLLINARSETAEEKPTFRESFHKRRVLVPASGYYEWEKREKARVRYAIAPKSGTAYLVGLYRNGETGTELVILTREAAPSLRFIHPRMPVILRGEAAKAWLEPEADAARLLLQAEQEMVFAAAEDEMLRVGKTC